jgi:hypothetical protein
VTAVETHRPHGTHVKYVIDKCRCQECRDANRDYERARKLRREPAYVGASRARHHLQELADAGVGLKSVARITGLSTGSLSKLVYGDYARGRGPSKRIRRETEQKILAITTHDAPGGTREPAGPTWEIVEQLLARGWQKAEIGRRIAGPDAKSLQLGRGYVTRENARIIRSLLDEPVPPRRSRHGLHAVPRRDGEAELRDEARRAQQNERRSHYRHLDDDDQEPVEAVDRYQLPRLTIDDLDDTWRSEAACRHPSVPTWIFFPGRGDRTTFQAAREVCDRCPVHEQCLDFAMRAGVHDGVWGGLSEKGRRSMRRTSRDDAA